MSQEKPDSDAAPSSTAASTSHKRKLINILDVQNMSAHINFTFNTEKEQFSDLHIVGNNSKAIHYTHRSVVANASEKLCNLIKAGRSVKGVVHLTLPHPAEIVNLLLNVIYHNSNPAWFHGVAKNAHLDRLLGLHAAVRLYDLTSFAPVVEGAIISRYDQCKTQEAKMVLKHFKETKTGIDSLAEHLAGNFARTVEVDERPIVPFPVFMSPELAMAVAKRRGYRPAVILYCLPWLDIAGKGPTLGKYVANTLFKIKDNGLTFASQERYLELKMLCVKLREMPNGVGIKMEEAIMDTMVEAIHAPLL